MLPGNDPKFTRPSPSCDTPQIHAEHRVDRKSAGRSNRPNAAISRSRPPASASIRPHPAADGTVLSRRAVGPRHRWLGWPRSSTRAAGGIGAHWNCSIHVRGTPFPATSRRTPSAAALAPNRASRPHLKCAIRTLQKPSTPFPHNDRPSSRLTLTLKSARSLMTQRKERQLRVSNPVSSRMSLWGSSLRTRELLALCAALRPKPSARGRHRRCDYRRSALTVR